jgi:hypothetical protein
MSNSLRRASSSAASGARNQNRRSGLAVAVHFKAEFASWVIGGIAREAITKFTPPFEKTELRMRPMRVVSGIQPTGSTSATSSDVCWVRMQDEAECLLASPTSTR